MILIVADGQPCTLRSALPAEGQKIAFLEINPGTFPRMLAALLEDRELELVVIECIFNEKKGLRLLDEIKRRRFDVPVIFVCAAGSDHTMGEALGLGAREYFHKPVDVARFREQVRTLQKLRRASGEQRVPLRPVETGDANPCGATSDAPDSILRAICYIEDHLTEHLDVERLARVACMSPFHFCRVFKRYTTKSPMQYVVRVRVKKAEELLRYNSGNMSICRIATSVGFYDASNFNRHFKKTTGLTPSAFKNSVKLSKG